MLMNQSMLAATNRPLPPTIDIASLPGGGGRSHSETELIYRLQQGEDGAFEILVRQYGGAMLAVARRMLRNEEAAKDVVQDAFLQAFRAINRFREDSRLSTWLHRIVVNAALMRMRSASRRPEQSIDELLPQFDDHGAHVEPVGALPVDAEEALASSQVRAQVRACIAELPEQYRAVISLRDFEELSTAEVATVLGISENAVKIRLHRARQALRTLLSRVLDRDGSFCFPCTSPTITTMASGHPKVRAQS